MARKILARESSFCSIYKMDFPNGKIYIGQTWVGIKERFQSHIEASYRFGRKRQSVSNAIAKYRPENVNLIK